jgi:hypothetical protein
MQRVPGGWQIRGITAYQSGLPLTVGLTGSTIGLPCRPDVLLGCNLQGRKTQQQWFNTACFQAPPLGHYGDSTRNPLRGAGIQKWDIGLFKNFHLREAVNVQFRWEMFKAFNHTNFDTVATTSGAGNFGQVTAARDPRMLHFGLKLEF